MKTTIYCTNTVLHSPSPSLRSMLAMLEWLEWEEPKFIVGIEELARQTRGHFNPTYDFAMVMPGGGCVRNPIDLATWICQEGVAPL